MDYKSIIRDLENKIYKPVYLFYGHESYFVDELTNYIAKNVLTESEKAFNQTILYGRDIIVKDVVEMCKRYPMMANLQVVIIKEAQDIKKFKDFEDYLVNPVASTLLVFSFKNTERIDKRLKVNSLISKKGVIFESKKFYERDTYSWITTALKEKKLTIHPEALRLFYESIGADLTRLSNEILKLQITIPKGETQVDKNLVASNIGVNRDFNIFELQKALGKKDMVKVYKIVDYFSKNQKANPLIGTVARLFEYFKKVIIVHTLQDKSKNSIASAIGVSPYFSDEYIQATRNYSLAKLLNIVSYLRDSDAKLKGVGADSPSDGDLSKELFFKILH